MAAPDGTVWGSIVGDYGRLGIYVSSSITDTTATFSIQVWIWAKYSIVDSNNSFYFDNNATSATTNLGSRSLSFGSNSGAAWSANNTALVYSTTYGPVNRGASDVTVNCAARFTNIDRIGGAILASTSYTIPKLARYAVTYYANGGSSAPASQEKIHGTTLVLSSTTPSRTGYSFAGWATSSGSTTVSYQPGSNYTTNAVLNLYAVWTPNTYTVSYDYNGGSGSIPNQTKTYGVNLTLSSAIPTRTNYTFVGWGVAASSTSASYQPGGTYTNNAAITLYAIWNLAYVKPSISNLQFSRCNSSGTKIDSGTYFKVEGTWSTFISATSISFGWKTSSSGWSTYTVNVSGTSGSLGNVVGGGALSTDYTYDVRIIITDSMGSTTLYGVLASVKYPIDFYGSASGGVAFGKAAESPSLLDVGYESVFRGATYGKVYGLDYVPAIPQNSDFNSYVITGVYAVTSNAAANTMTNMPNKVAGKLIVEASLGISPTGAWAYVTQTFKQYNGERAYVRLITTSETASQWTYGPWKILYTASSM